MNTNTVVGAASGIGSCMRPEDLQSSMVTATVRPTVNAFAGSTVAHAPEQNRIVERFFRSL